MTYIQISQITELAQASWERAGHERVAHIESYELGQRAELSGSTRKIGEGVLRFEHVLGTESSSRSRLEEGTSEGTLPETNCVRTREISVSEESRPIWDGTVPLTAATDPGFIFTPTT